MTTGYELYCADILSGKIPSCIHVKNAVNRFKSDLLRTDFEFRPEAVTQKLDFISQLKHFTGRYSGRKFVLEPWQEFIIANIYGFYRNDGTRRFRTAYLEMARKNGKTSLGSALCLAGLIADNEDAPEILLAANSKDQARIAFRLVSGFAKEYDPDELTLRRYRSDINYVSENTQAKKSRGAQEPDGFIKTLAADATVLDGYNCSLGIIDEFHSAPDSTVRDVIRSSMGMRDSPLLLTITTAGFDKSLPCYDLRSVCSEIISGLKKDDSFFGIIYTLDTGDDWKNPDVWIKSNPNLGVTVKQDFLAEQVLQASLNPSDETGVKTKNLNIWCDSSSTWIPDDYIISATSDIKKSDFKDKEVYVGADLSQNVDFTAVSYLYVEGEGETSIFNFYTDFYLPEESLHRTNLHADKNLYKQWAGAKYLITTPGNVTDYDYITKDLLDMDKITDLRRICYDRYNSTQWCIQATEAGLRLKPFSQTVGNFNGCTKEFERLILSGRVRINDNPIVRYCLRNVTLKVDELGNCKPRKDNEKKKIDGVISMLMALGAYQELTANRRETQIF
jgi:phage terminase large subunit-like protein